MEIDDRPGILMTREEVMQTLRVSESTLHRMLNKGLLPRVRIAGRVFITRGDVLKLLKPTTRKLQNCQCSNARVAR
jgi:predicted site-specific integrase-resolvase